MVTLYPHLRAYRALSDRLALISPPSNLLGKLSRIPRTEQKELMTSLHHSISNAYAAPVMEEVDILLFDIGLVIHVAQDSWLPFFFKGKMQCAIYL